jgi:hypothetical protein
MNKTILKALIFINMMSGVACAKGLSFTEQACLPPSAQEIFAARKLDAKYKFSSHMNPFFVQGDFDGDHHLDVAVLVIEKASGKKGIAIFHLGTAKVFVIGAGKSFGNGDDDFAWLDAWYAYPKSKVGLGAGETSRPKLRGDAIFVIKTGSASAIVYWDGRRYCWYQQGD